MSSVVQYRLAPDGIAIDWGLPPWKSTDGLPPALLPLPAVFPNSDSELIVVLKRMPEWDGFFDHLAREVSEPWFTPTWSGAGGTGLTAALEAAEIAWRELDPAAEHSDGLPAGFERHFEELLRARVSTEFALLASACRRMLSENGASTGPHHWRLPLALAAAADRDTPGDARSIAECLAIELSVRGQRQFLSRAQEVTLRFMPAVEFELATPYDGPLRLEEDGPSERRGSRRFRPDASLRALVQLLRLTPGDLCRAAKAVDGSLSASWLAELGYGAASPAPPVLSADELYGLLSHLPRHPNLQATRHAALLVGRIPLRDLLCLDPRPGHATARLFGGGLAMVALNEFVTSSLRALPAFSGVFLPSGTTWRLASGPWIGADANGRLVVSARPGLSAEVLTEASPEPLTELCVEYGRFPLPPAGQRAGEVRALTALQESGRSSLARSLERELQGAGEEWPQRLRILRRYVRLRQRPPAPAPAAEGDAVATGC